MCRIAHRVQRHSFTRPTLVEAVLMLVGLLALAPGGAILAAGTSGVNCNTTPNDPSCFRQLPLRWCALAGSDAADNPAALGDSTTSLVLWRRHERPSDSVYIPRANVTFRSALWAAAQANNFPIIRAADLDTTGVPAGSPLRSGDVNASDASQVQALIQTCNRMWENNVAPAFPGQSLVGVPAINVRQILTNNPGDIVLGWGGYAVRDLATPGVADDVNTPERFEPRHFIVADLTTFWNTLNSTAYFACETDRGVNNGWGTIVGHELGHTLGLGDNVGMDNIIGNGDDPANLMSSGQCDRTLGANIRDSVYSSGPPGPFIRTIADQVDWIKRSSRANWPGANWDPPGVILPGSYQSFTRTDPLGDVPAGEGFVDLATLEVMENTQQGSSGFTFVLKDFMNPSGSVLSYWVLADLDMNPSTGGMAADLPAGVPTTDFDGAEFVARIQVTNGPVITGALWKWNGSQFSQSVSEFIATFRKFEGADHGAVPAFQYLTIQFPTGERGPVSSTFRLEALTHNSATGTVDRLPAGPDVDGDNAPDAGELVSLVPPTLPACGATPFQAGRGDMVTLDVSGLLPSTGVHVNVGGRDLVNGMTDPAGDASLPFMVPLDMLPGLHLLTAGSEDTALTADCMFEVINVPACMDDTDCLQGQFCQRERGVCQGGGFCTTRPTECPDVSDPVCGCDQQTYQNECAAAAAAVSVAFGGTCEGAATPTVTPTATPTQTPLGPGQSCSAGTQCASTFCVDGVCCDTACTGPLQQCNVAGAQGTCTNAVAPAPALTAWGWLVALMLLAGVAGIALQRSGRRR